MSIDPTAISDWSNDRLLSEWKAAKSALDAAKAAEATLRPLVVQRFGDGKPGESGVRNYELGWGHTLKIEYKLDYKLDNSDDSAKVDAALDAIEKSQEGGNVIAERLVKWKPELSVSEYKKLNAAQKAIIDRVLTIKDASPTVTIVPPKGA